eukprot:1973634-Alexandrium_andersonii.AAC.1
MVGELRLGSPPPWDSSIRVSALFGHRARFLAAAISDSAGGAGSETGPSGSFPGVELYRAPGGAGRQSIGLRGGPDSGDS